MHLAPSPVPILHEAEISLVYITPQEDVKQFYNLLEKKKTLLDDRLFSGCFPLLWMKLGENRCIFRS